MSNNLFSSVADWLTSIFGDSRLSKVLASIFALFLIGVGVLLWDSITGDFTLRRLETQIRLLSELQELEEADIASSTELNPIYEKLSKELEGYDPHFVTMPQNFTIYFNANFWQMIGGSIIWLFLTLYFWISNNQSIGIAAAAMLFAIMMGFASMLIPDSPNNWINSGVAFGIQIIIVILIAIRGSRINKKPTGSQSTTTISPA